MPPPPYALSRLIYAGDLAYIQKGRWRARWTTTVAAVTVVEYLVETYGREQLPAFVAGMRLYDTWDELVPQVLDVTAGEFEAGWQAYLAEEYGAVSNRN